MTPVSLRKPSVPSRRPKPSTASMKPADQLRRRNSPSVTLGRPIDSWKATISRMQSSCTAINCGRSACLALCARAASTGASGARSCRCAPRGKSWELEFSHACLSRRPHRQPAAPAEAARGVSRARREGNVATPISAPHKTRRSAMSCKLQQDCGLQVVTDGEFRRISYWEKFVRLTTGPGGEGRGVQVPRRRTATRSTSPRPTSAARCRAPSRSRSTNLPSAQADQGDQKITMPAPSTMHFYRFTDWGTGAYRQRERSSRISARSTRREIADLAQGRLPLRADRRGGGGDPLRSGGRARR